MCYTSMVSLQSKVYKRSPGMTEYEFHLFLGIQSNGSYWKKQESNAKTEDGKRIDSPSAFGFEMQTDDGVVRAKKMGNGLCFLILRMCCLPK